MDMLSKKELEVLTGKLERLLFALGTILFAIRGYLNTGDKAVTGALIFIALVAIKVFSETEVREA
jgi:hypothetical protein